ncbi:MAG: hypothetical protein FRX48_01373 [Lasallia pustulata]|uniref:DUF7730 domain-containing protein n=1 Tax=Lasallia pustulata TaxID=136370 RepID=A0A5M8PY29_9LECA|nr:MAG: hypothetical protein FRX48_01373 [Lasallia pustulata]
MGKRKRAQGNASGRRSLIQAAPPASSPSGQPEQGDTNLFTLPPELRNRIYELVLRADSSVTEPFGPVFDVHGLLVEACNHLSILSVCRQIYLESFHVFYSKNCLLFSSTECLFHFLSSIGHARRQEITSIMLRWQAEDPNPKRAFRLLHNCQKLRNLYLKIPSNQPPGFAALREVRGLECVMICHDSSEAEVLEHIRPYLSSQNYGVQCDRVHFEQIQALMDDCRCPDANDLRAAMCRPRLEQRKPRADTVDLFRKDRLKLWRNEGDKLAEAHVYGMDE